MSWSFFQEFLSVARKFRRVILRYSCLSFWLIRFVISLNDSSITLIGTTFLALHENLRWITNSSSLEKHVVHVVHPFDS